MKRIISSICILYILTLLLCSCGLFGPQKFKCEISEVKSAQIVRLDKLIKDEYRYEYEILADINDLETFIDRLNTLKHWVYWGDPRVLRLDYIVIKIDYINGDYDLIHQSTQMKHRSGSNNTGFFSFDEGQFNALITDYITE